MTDSELRLPVKDALREPFDDLEVEAAQARMRARTNARRETRGARPWVLGTAALALCALVAMLVVSARSPGRLGVAGHPFLGVLEGHRSVGLDDGSRIDMADGTRLAVLENGDRELGLLLARGRATFDVQPGGPRRWTIECGLAKVVVLGTRFTIERSTANVRVSVARGVVLVHGELVPDRAQQLTAGQSIEVRASAASAASAVSARTDRVELGGDGDARAVAADAPDALPVEGALPLVASSPARPNVVGRPASSGRDESRRGGGHGSWRALAERGGYAEAYGELGPNGIRERARLGDVDELLALADVARLSGHPADAVAPLERILTAHRGDANAPLAAFTLGRVEADALSRPAQAARAFADALGLGLPRALEPDALARLAKARLAAGDAAGAREAAARYLTVQPRGAHADAMQRLVETSR